MKNLKKCASAIIVNAKEEMLIVKRSDHDPYPNAWSIPGGKLEEGEDFVAAVIREIMEETGIDISAHISKREHFLLFNDEVEIAYFVIILDTNPDVILNEEHSEYKWIEEPLNVFNYIKEDQTPLTYKAFCIVGTPTPEIREISGIKFLCPGGIKHIEDMHPIERYQAIYNLSVNELKFIIDKLCLTIRDMEGA